RKNLLYSADLAIPPPARDRAPHASCSMEICDPGPLPRTSSTFFSDTGPPGADLLALLRSASSFRYPMHHRTHRPESRTPNPGLRVLSLHAVGATEHEQEVALPHLQT